MQKTVLKPVATGRHCFQTTGRIKESQSGIILTTVSRPLMREKSYIMDTAFTNTSYLFRVKDC
jgi:hypothetical protein